MTKENLYKFLLSLFFLFILIFFTFDSFAEKGKVTKLEIPRFVSLKSNDINLRVGPSKNYPILLNYTSINLPIEIIDEFDVWRKTKDYNNNIGWLHKSLIKGDRFIIVDRKFKKNKNIFNRPNGKIIGIIQINNIVKLEKCLKNWCYIYHKDLEGWIPKKNIWGVYSKEIYNLSYLQPIINKYWEVLDYNWLRNTAN